MALHLRNDSVVAAHAPFGSVLSKRRSLSARRAGSGSQREPRRAGAAGPAGAGGGRRGRPVQTGLRPESVGVELHGVVP